MVLGLFCGRFEFLGKHWNCFVFGSDGILYSSDGAFIYPGEIRALPWIYKTAGMKRQDVCGNLNNKGILYSIAPNAEKKVIFSFSKLESSSDELKLDEKLVFFDVAKNALKNKK